MAANCASRSSGDKRKASEDSDEGKSETITAWKKAFRSFSCQRRLQLPMKRTLVVHWNNFSEGFFVRESEEVLFRALGDEGKMCYFGEMFDSWTYFSPVEMKGKASYGENKDLKEIANENILSEIHHLTMAYKAAQLEEFPDSYTERQVEQPKSGYSSMHAEDSLVHPSHLANLYWEAKAQGFSDLRGKLFAEAFLKLLFTGIENVNVTYSTKGCDTRIDRWGYIQDGPTQRSLECPYSGDNNPYNTSVSKHKYRTMLKYSKNIAFDLKTDSRKATSDVSVCIGNDLVLIAEIANVSDSEHKKIHQLHINMLLSLNRHRTLFGMLIQGHQVYLAEYTFIQSGGYKREFSQNAFKYQKDDLKLLYSYLQTHFLSI